MIDLGRKIVVVGVSASGKSVFTRKLASKTNLPTIFMDAIMWKSGWNYIGDAETVKKLDEVSSSKEWIIEGYISKDARTFVFERADTIIYLDYSPLVSSWRYIKRWWKHRKEPRPELEGSPEKFDFKFLKLVWTKGEAISLNKFLTQVKNKNKIITLKSPRETKMFLKKIKTSSNNHQKLYRYTSNGEGIFFAGKKFLPESLVGEAWEARKWMPKPQLSEGEYKFFLTEAGKEKYEETLLKVHQKYLSNIKVEEVNPLKIGPIIYEDEWQVVIKK